MPAPQVWLRSAIEAAAAVNAYPLSAPEGTAPPYVVYERTGTARVEVLDATLGDPPNGEVQPPTASVSVVVYADDYVGAWDLAAQIVAAVHLFAGEHEGTTINLARVVGEQDGAAFYLDGRDVPTYTVEISVEILWTE